jgi:methionyl aminopeptidase
MRKNVIHLKSPEEVRKLKSACILAAETLRDVGALVRPGMTTRQIDDLVFEYLISRGAYPAPLHYRGFPASVCTSINNVVCHGIPSEKVIVKSGDLVNIDVTSYLADDLEAAKKLPVDRKKPLPNDRRRGIKGFHGDTNATFLVGEVAPKAARLVEVTREAMWRGIDAAKPGNRLGDIGHAIQKYVEEMGFSVVRDYCGHGIGRDFHEEPTVVHYGTPGKGIRLVPGMTFTIEPMVNAGDYHVKLLDDGWTVLTKDGSLSAQFEHTIVITETGNEVLTCLPDSPNRRSDLPVQSAAQR